MYEIIRYQTPDGKEVFSDWLKRLRDQSAKRAIGRRLVRLLEGNFGDHKFCRSGVWELRIDVGAGYRVYYGLAGTQIVLLLCGGDKSSQAADIAKACLYWQDARKELEL